MALFVMLQPTLAADSYTTVALPLANNYVPDGNQFMFSQDGSTNIAIDFQTHVIKAKLNLSDCTATNENILSVGNEISVWNETTTAVNLHFYYTASTHRLIIDYKDNPNRPSTGDGKAEEVLTLTSNTLSIEIGDQGLLVNGEQQASYSASALQSLLALSTIQIGSTQATPPTWNYTWRSRRQHWYGTKTKSFTTTTIAKRQLPATAIPTVSFPIF